MRFLLDQDVYATTARFLTGLPMTSFRSLKSDFHKQMTKNCSRLPKNKVESSSPEIEISAGWSS